jgi:AcrR family transcriptional regulator
VTGRKATSLVDLPPPGRAIADVAVGLFDRHGYDATGVQQIVDAAGVTKGAFYHYFATKDDLLRMILEEYIDGALAEVVAIHDADATSSEKLRQVIRHILESLVANRESVSVFLRDRRALTDESFAAIKVKRDAYSDVLTAIVEAGMAAGELARRGAPRVVAFGIVGMCVWGREWLDPGGPAAVPEIADWYADMVLDGLRLRPSA